MPRPPRAIARSTPPPEHASILVAGGAHACATFDGSLACWGANDHAELGDGTTVERSVPTRVDPLAGLEALALGRGHACAVANGRVLCWGDGSSGQLGDGTTTGHAAPEAVVGLDGQRFVEVGAGDDHSCARSRDGAVFCWGINAHWEVGTRDANASDVAQSDVGQEAVVRARRVPLDSPAARLAVRGGLSCVLSTTGTVVCWGAHWLDGWLGHGDARGGRAPAAVPGITGASSIAVGGAFVCAIVNGRVRCHGDNLNGQLGDADAGCCAEPPETVTVAGVSDAVELASGMMHACARLRTGAVVCWGDARSEAQLGSSPTDERRRARASTVLAGGAVAIAAGDFHTCARRQDGSVACWGKDDNGQLGDGISRRVTTPVLVAGLTDVARVTAGYVHTCAQDRSGQVTCWGASAPRHVAPLDGGRGLAAGIYETCTIAGPRRLTCAARMHHGVGGDLAGSVTVAFDVAEIAASEGACARGTDGRVACWTEYSDAHVIRSDAPPRLASPIAGGRRVTAISVGSRLCGLRDGGVVCWPTESPTRSGAVSSVAGESVEIALPAGDPPVGLAVGGAQECVWTRGGRAMCWEPPGREAAPREVAGLSNVEQIVAGRGHVCARTRDGVLCWGANEKGQIGDGVATFGRRPAPVPVVGLPPDVAEITAGAAHTCARTVDGRVWCWGDDDRGLLGRAVALAPRGPVDARLAPAATTP